MDWETITDRIPHDQRYYEQIFANDYIRYVFVRSKRNIIYCLFHYDYTVRGTMFRSHNIMRCTNEHGLIGFQSVNNEKRIRERYFANWIMEQLL